MNDFIEGLKMLLVLFGNVLFGAVALLIIAVALVFTGFAIWKIFIVAAELFKIDL